MRDKRTEWKEWCHRTNSGRDAASVEPGNFLRWGKWVGGAVIILPLNGLNVRTHFGAIFFN